MQQDSILILDFGSQYTQLIARRLRELGIYCEIGAHDIKKEAIIAFAPKGIILSGGPSSVTDEDAPSVSSFLFELHLPVLGICYGMQAMARHFGGKVEKAINASLGTLWSSFWMPPFFQELASA